MGKALMYLCSCKGVSDKDVCRLGRCGIVSPEALIEALELDDEECCGRCALMIDTFAEIAEQAQEGAAQPPLRQVA